MCEINEKHINHITSFHPEKGIKRMEGLLRLP
jgi:hypothetical protein